MRYLLLVVGVFFICSLAPLFTQAAPDKYLPELAKDYVYWGTKILLCQQSGCTSDADKARERMRRAEGYLFHSIYTQSEATEAIREAKAYYTKNPIRGGC